MIEAHLLKLLSEPFVQFFGTTQVTDYIRLEITV
jgi:hypothetical protein